MQDPNVEQGENNVSAASGSAYGNDKPTDGNPAEQAGVPKPPVLDSGSANGSANKPASGPAGGSANDPASGSANGNPDQDDSDKKTPKSKLPSLQNSLLNDASGDAGCSDCKKKDGKKPPARSIILYVLIAVVVIAIVVNQVLATSNKGSVPDEITTNEFVTAVDSGMVTEVTYFTSTAVLEGKYYKDETAKENNQTTDFTSIYVGNDSLNELMREHLDIQFKIDVSSSSWITSLLSTLIPMLLIVGVLIFFMSQMNGINNKQMQFGKTKAKKLSDDTPKVKFSDVAGIDEAVEELQEIKDFLANPARYQAMGAKIPRGVLLVGPPGTGKTLLARAVAGEAGVPFFSISGSDFVEMFVGVGASRVRDLFEEAKKAAPAIIFIDEIDAVGRQRGAGLGGGHDEREQTLNQLLVEMDGFESNESVIMIAATNRVDILDPALLRPGRFDRQVTVTPPDLKGREAIMRVHAEGKPIDDAVDFKKLASLTSGFTGAELANLLNEAALLTARRKKSVITHEEIMESMERVIAGPERKGRVMTQAEKRTIAYHESGHALVGHLLEHTDPVAKISIIARGMALGYTLSLPEEDHFLQSKNQMTDTMAMCLGGRVAEEIFVSDITTGASNDLERATKMAKGMVTRYGMSDVLGHQVYGEQTHNPFLGRDFAATPDYSEETASVIDQEVAHLMTAAHDTAYAILDARRDQMTLMASVLMERETVDGKACQMLLDNQWDAYLAWEKEHPEELDQNKGMEGSGNDGGDSDGDGSDGSDGGARNARSDAVAGYANPTGRKDASASPADSDGR